MVDSSEHIVLKVKEEILKILHIVGGELSGGVEQLQLRLKYLSVQFKVGTNYKV